MFELKKIDKYFLFILCIGLIFRLVALFKVDAALDSYTYLAAAKSIIAFDYNSFRAPGFPIFMIPFFLFPHNYPLINAPESKIVLIILNNPNLIITAQITSMSAGILLIISSYFVFSKAAIKLSTKEGKITQNNAKYVGLIVSCLISFSLPFIINSVQGLREELLAVLILIIFYYVIIKEKLALRDNLFLALSIALLTLTHLTAGIFITVGIILFFLVSKLKFFKFNNISNLKILICLLGPLISFLLWGWFCYVKFGDPLYSLKVQRDFFKDTYNLDLSSINNIISALINGIINGIPLEFYFLFIFNGIVFMLLGLYVLIKYIKQKQFLFIFIITGVNFAYLSVFMAIPGDLRLLLYFFPIIIYLGALPIGITINDSTHKSAKFMKYLLIIFFLTYSFRGLKNLGFFSYLFVNYFSEIIYWLFFLINEGSLLIYLIKIRNKFILKILK